MGADEEHVVLQEPSQHEQRILRAREAEQARGGRAYARIGVRAATDRGGDDGRRRRCVREKHQGPVAEHRIGIRRELHELGHEALHPPLQKGCRPRPRMVALDENVQEQLVRFRDRELGGDRDDAADDAVAAAAPRLA